MKALFFAIFAFCQVTMAGVPNIEPQVRSSDLDTLTKVLDDSAVSAALGEANIFSISITKESVSTTTKYNFNFVASSADANGTHPCSISVDAKYIGGVAGTDFFIDAPVTTCAGDGIELDIQATGEPMTLGFPGDIISIPGGIAIPTVAQALQDALTAPEVIAAIGDKDITNIAISSEYNGGVSPEFGFDFSVLEAGLNFPDGGPTTHPCSIFVATGYELGVVGDTVFNVEVGSMICAQNSIQF